MSPDKQRIAIAEACGWRQNKGNPFFWTGPNGESTMHVAMPDYLNDLNAMHEAEQFIVQFENMMLYRDCLFMAVGLNPIYWAHQCPAPEFLKVATANAAQRAEAFLKTIGKWEEK